MIIENTDVTRTGSHVSQTNN